MKRLNIFILIITLAGFLAACGISSSINIKNDDSGTIGISLKLGELTSRYLLDLAESQGAFQDGSAPYIFKKEDISFYLQSLEGASLDYISVPAVDELNIGLECDDIWDFLSESLSVESAGVIEAAGKKTPVLQKIDNGEGIFTASFIISRENVGQLLKLFPSSGDPVSESAMLLFEDHGSQAEFKEMIFWVLEEYATEDEISKMMEEARFRLNFSVPGKVLSVKGAEESGGRIILNVPVIRLFTLEEALEVDIRYKLN